jgi:hypothetical protein
MEWFRFYDEVLNDPKVQRLQGELFKTWVNLLCLASQDTERGYLPASMEDTAWALRMPIETLRERFTQLQEQCFIDFDSDLGRYKMHGWDNRQKRSDDVTARVQKHRARQKEGETLPERSGNALEQNREEKNRVDRADPRAGARGNSLSRKNGGTNGRNTAKPTLVEVFGDLAKQAHDIGEEPDQRSLPPKRA